MKLRLTRSKLRFAPPCPTASLSTLIVNGFSRSRPLRFPKRTLMRLLPDRLQTKIKGTRDLDVTI